MLTPLSVLQVSSPLTIVVPLTQKIHEFFKFGPKKARFWILMAQSYTLNIAEVPKWLFAALHFV